MFDIPSMLLGAVIVGLIAMIVMTTFRDPPAFP